MLVSSNRAGIIQTTMTAYLLDTKRRPALLLAMLRYLAGPTSRVRFQGYLANSELASLDGAIVEEMPAAKGASPHPQWVSVALSLTQETLPGIEKAITSKIAFRGSQGIVHVEIESDGGLTFAAYDSFHPETVVAYDIPTALLDSLVQVGTLRSYRVSQPR